MGKSRRFLAGLFHFSIGFNLTGLYPQILLKSQKSEPSAFGRRLEALRKARGLTQLQVAKALETTQRTVSYYETQGGSPPAYVVVALAKLLHVSADELLGLKPSKVEHKKEDPEKQRLWKRFQRMASLPERDQRAVIRLISSLVSASDQQRGRA